VQDYAAYVSANGADPSWRKVTFRGAAVSSGPDEPVTMVTWKMAREFCEWLTREEQKEARLAAR
jgi:formylglycine-generating enzyme required for sulfatase activity